jgi:hypothetical protein
LERAAPPPQAAIDDPENDAARPAAAADFRNDRRVTRLPKAPVGA